MFSTNSSVTQLFKITGMPSAMRDCSTYKFQCTSFLKFESHDKTDYYIIALIILDFVVMII